MVLPGAVLAPEVPGAVAAEMQLGGTTKVTPAQVRGYFKCKGKEEFKAQCARATDAVSGTVSVGPDVP